MGGLIRTFIKEEPKRVVQEETVIQAKKTEPKKLARKEYQVQEDLVAPVG